MKLRFTFGLKTLFIATAILGLVLWAELWIKQRRQEFAWRAFMHQQEAYYSVTLEVRYSDNPEKVIEEFYSQLDAYQTYQKQMLKKYEYAAKYPWLPVTPDPVSPEKP